MTPDLPPQPPEGSPPAVVIQAPKSLPIVIESNGIRYTVIDNTLLAESQVIEAIRSGTDPKTSFNALHQAYLSAGYFLVTLVGKVDGNDIEVKVVQGRVTELVASPDITPYFTRLKEREDIDRASIIRSSTLAEAYAARQGLSTRIKFEPGAEYGGSKMTVTDDTALEGAKPWSALLAFNNFGNRYSARYVAQGNASWRPGGGLELTAGYAQGLPELTQESKGSSYKTANLGASLVTSVGIYSVAINQTYYQYGDSISFFHPQGDVSSVGLTGFQLAFADDTTRLSFTETYTHFGNKVTISDPEFTLTDQSYDQLGVGVTYNKGYSAFGLQGSAVVTVNANKGISGHAGTFGDVQPGASTPRYSLVQGSLALAQGLPMGFSANVTASGQVADLEDSERLPSQQQWVLGGYGNLTAWYPGVVSGDTGYLARAAVNGPSWNVWEMLLTPTIFAEAGYSRTSYKYPNVPNSQFLSDYGISVSGTAFKRTSMTMAYAWPWRTRDVGTQVVDGSRARLFFNVAINF